MRVAVTVEQAWHRVPGGTAWSVLELLRAMVATGRVDLVGVAARHEAPPADQWVPPIAVRHLPLPRLALYEAWHAVRRPRVEQATGAVDVVHATAVAYPGAKAPVVVTIHDLAFLQDPSQATRHGNRFFRRGLELARRHARLVLCPSEATAAECEAAGIDRGRVRVVPWGVAPSVVAPTDVERVKAAYALARPYVLFCGTLEPRKNLPRLVDAYRRLGADGVDLVLAGPEGWHEDAPRLLAGLEGRAHALGFVPRADVDALMAGAAVLAYPSLREGFGLPVLEAMAQGTPVVTSAGTATEEVIGDAGLVVDPLDVDAIAAALDRVLGDADEATRFGAAGRARATEFTWARSAELTIAAYEEVVAS